jgi:hypothetical protein
MQILMLCYSLPAPNNDYTVTETRNIWNTDLLISAAGAKFASADYKKYLVYTWLLKSLYLYDEASQDTYLGMMIEQTIQSGKTVILEQRCWAK